MSTSGIDGPTPVVATSTRVPDRTVTVPWPRILWITGGALLATMLPHIAALIVTGGPVTGPVSLRKPATFAETGWLLCWSAALLWPALRLRGWRERYVGGAVVLFSVGETAIMAIQAWRGVPSHYNFTTPFDTALMRGGAAGTAGIFVIAVLILLVTTLRARLPGPLRLGVLAGVLLLLLGCALGLIMIFNNSGVFQGTIGAGFTERTAGYLGPDAATLGREYLLIRPSTRGGDLVLLHAVGVHGLLLLAVPAVVLARTAAPSQRQWGTVGTAVAATATAVTILLAHALRTLPLDELGAPALAALGICAAALLGSYSAVGAALLRTRT